jgi:hypothetical protein
MASPEGTFEKALRAVEYARGESGDRRACKSNNLIDKTNAALSSGISLEYRKGDRYDKECEE